MLAGYDHYVHFHRHHSIAHAKPVAGIARVVELVHVPSVSRIAVQVFSDLSMDLLGCDT
jgi:hypothetical protein